jgi:transcriptional regulator with XRE-family HTH domain
MGLTDELTQDYISAYERGVREPPLPVLLKYAQVAGVYVDALINDDVDLPKRLPCYPRSEGIIRTNLKKRSERRSNNFR